MTLWLAIGIATASVQDVAKCLERNDVPCADAELARMGAEDSRDPDVLWALARTHFFAGRYPEAHDALKAAVDAGFKDQWEQLPLYERTMYVTAGWTEKKSGRFKVRYKPGVDAILVDEALDALDRSERFVTPLLGKSPPGETILEIYPDGRSFIAASSLTQDAVETTGTVALSKWSRLLLTSPRALGGGYDWKDTIAHEYIHLVVAHNTSDETPVWLQEAIAKYLDNRWRDGADHFRLDVRRQGLLARAIAEDDLVTFDEMHPSLAMLPSAERASLAYAQLAMLMRYCFEHAGSDVLLRALPLVEGGTDPREALATAAGFTDFAGLEAAWLQWMAEQPLLNKALSEIPTKLDGGGNDIETDPVLSHREDLARYVRLGDLLRTEKQRPLAALVEYRKAVPDDEPQSPLLANRIALAHLDLGATADAKAALQESLVNYPDFGLTHETLGKISAREGQLLPAIESYRTAAELDPFDQDVLMALEQLYGQVGNVAERARYERYLRILRRGGEDGDLVVLHERSGTFELPRDGGGNKQSALEQRHMGRVAPPLELVGLDGAEVDWAGLQGKVVLLDFWATWCGPCRAAIPKIEQIYRDHGRADLEVVGVSDEATPAVQRFVQKNPIAYRVAVAPQGDAADRYGVRSLPTLFVVDRQGVVRAIHIGAGDLSEVADQVNELVQRGEE